jgi:hypothetical protein
MFLVQSNEGGWDGHDISMHGLAEKCIQNLVGETLREETTWRPRGIILKGILSRMWTGFVWLRIGSRDGLKHSNESSVSIKCSSFNKLSKYYILKKNSAPWN